VKPDISNKTKIMTSPFRNLRHFSLPLVLAFLCAIALPLHSEDAVPTDGAFIHLSAGPDNPHRVLMALKMAVVMAEGNKDVLVYCDIEAVKLLLKDAPDVTHNAFDSSAALLAKLAKMNVPVRACPSCLKAAGKTPEDLLPGIKTADRDEFFSFTKGRILTLDY
jgi:predicted peroxiredoxin